MITTKIFQSTMDEVKVLKDTSPDKLNQAQVIAKAVKELAEKEGFIDTIDGLVTVGDTIRFLDGSISTILKVTNKAVVLSTSKDPVVIERYDKELRYTRKCTEEQK